MISMDVALTLLLSELDVVVIYLNNQDQDVAPSLLTGLGKCRTNRLSKASGVPLHVFLFAI